MKHKKSKGSYKDDVLYLVNQNRQLNEIAKKQSVELEFFVGFLNQKKLLEEFNDYVREQIVKYDKVSKGEPEQPKIAVEDIPVIKKEGELNEDNPGEP